MQNLLVFLIDDDIDDQEEGDPDDVDEVPVQAQGIDALGMLRPYAR